MNKAATASAIDFARDPRAALDAIAALLEDRPEEALLQAERLMRGSRQLAPAEFIACQALRRLGRAGEAAARLAVLARSQRRVPAVLWEWAQAASEAGRGEQAIAALEALTAQQPQVSTGWFLLARELRKCGRESDAWRADLSGVHAASRDPQLLKAAMAMNEGHLADAAAALEKRLVADPGDAPALRLLGEVRWREGDINSAIDKAARAVEIAPGFDLARDFLVRLLVQANRLTEAHDHAEMLARSPVDNPGHDLIRASVLVRLGEQARAGQLYEKLLAGAPDQPQVWQNYGHVLKTLGRQSEAVDAYREAVTRRPTMGEAWWSLANLKTVKLGEEDIAAMRAALEMLDPQGMDTGEDRFHLHFSLGKALEDAGEHEASFQHYASGNRLRRSMVVHDADAFSEEVTATCKALTPAFVSTLGEGGCPAPDPVFIVGLPRSGSTLIEQILASHSEIEGTMELPEMMMIAGRLQSRVDEGEFADYATMLSSLGHEDRTRLGEEYIERTRVHRQTARPLFIDKMPNNWQHVGLIRAILPRAKIIDARRHPMACCFSGWKQHFARGQTFTYNLAEIGRYYRDYVCMMARCDAIMPGAVHRVIYEEMVADTEAQVRRLLEYMGLPFESACLEFYKTDRAVRTASSEQVRQPIFTGGLTGWQAYAKWLAPLADALGPLVDAYPQVRG